MSIMWTQDLLDQLTNRLGPQGTGTGAFNINSGGGGYGGGGIDPYNFNPPIGIASAGSPYADLIQKLKGGYNPWDSMRGGNMYDQMLSNGLYSQMTGWKPTFPQGG